MSQVKTIEEIIREKGGFVKKSDLSSSQYHRLLALVGEGKVVRVRRGVYALNESFANSMYDLDKIIPGGILCNLSAWSHYGLTTQIPLTINIAIERKRKVTLPDYPPITLFYQSQEQLGLGVTRKIINGYEVSIFDMERSVCDALKQRNKIGMDVCSEILNNYLERKDRNLNKLSEYAKKLRVANLLHNYLEFAL